MMKLSNALTEMVQRVASSEDKFTQRLDGKEKVRAVARLRGGGRDCAHGSLRSARQHSPCSPAVQILMRIAKELDDLKTTVSSLPKQGATATSPTGGQADAQRANRLVQSKTAAKSHRYSMFDD